MKPSRMPSATPTGASHTPRLRRVPPQGQFSWKPCRDRKAGDAAPALPHGIEDVVVRRGVRIHPLQAGQLVEAADALDLGDDARRVARELLVVRGLEGERALARE